MREKSRERAARPPAGGDPPRRAGRRPPRGPHYRGPWRLPGPDSHRLADL